MKKSIRVLAATMAIVLAISACSNGTTPSSSSSTPASSGVSQASASDTGNPEERVKLEIALQSNSFVTEYDMDKNYFSKYIADYNNVDLSFYVLPSENAEIRTKISLMIASKDTLPDIINTDNSLTPETILDYGSKGAFIPLNDYLNDPQLTPNFAAVDPADKEVMLRTMQMADGNIYAMPKYEPETWNLTPTRMYMNREWLKKLDLAVPETIDDLYECLVAFRDKDPNGNNVQDEIGVYGYYAGGYGENIIAGLINSFTFWNNFSQNGGLALDSTGNTVIAPFVTPEFNDALRFLNKLYSEKLLAASLFTDDVQQYRAVLNNEVNIVGITSAGSLGNWPDANNNENFKELTIIAPLKGPNGIAYTPYTPYVPSLTMLITSNCKNPEVAMKFADSFLNPEVSDIARFGEFNVDWTIDPAEMSKTSNAFIEAGLYDSLRLCVVTNIWAEPSSQNWHNINPRYTPLDKGNTVGNLYAPYDPALPTSMPSAFNYEHYYPAHPDKVLPLLKYTVEEAQTNAETITNITDYVKQSIAEFVTGARNIDTGWEQYLKELDSMGMQEWMKTAQDSYDRSK